MALPTRGHLQQAELASEWPQLFSKSVNDARRTAQFAVFFRTAGDALRDVLTFQRSWSFGGIHAAGRLSPCENGATSATTCARCIDLHALLDSAGVSRPIRRFSRSARVFAQRALRLNSDRVVSRRVLHWASP